MGTRAKLGWRGAGGNSRLASAPQFQHTVPANTLVTPAPVQFECIPIQSSPIPLQLQCSSRTVPAKYSSSTVIVLPQRCSSTIPAAPADFQHNCSSIPSQLQCGRLKYIVVSVATRPPPQCPGNALCVVQVGGPTTPSRTDKLESLVSSREETFQTKKTPVRFQCSSGMVSLEF